MRHAVALAFLTVAVSACSEPLEFADWTIPVPEGTRIIEYAAVPIEERTERIELVPDMTIGEQEEDPNYILYRADEVVADQRGRIFVQDRGNLRIQAYDAAGTYLMTLGQEGQGPGEFTSMQGLALVNNRLIAYDARNARFNVFATDGELLPAISRDRVSGTPVGPVGLDGGTILARLRYRATEADLGDPTVSRSAVALFSDEMHQLQELLVFPTYRERMLTRGTPIRMAVTVPIPHPTQRLVASPSGMAYAAVTSEYQVYAVNPVDGVSWALRVAWQRIAITEAEIQGALEAIRARANVSDVMRSEYEWPEYRPAIETIATDGRGNLYVYLYPALGDEGSEERMVDVYSPVGELLFSGWIPNFVWRFARDDYVLAFESNDQTGEQRVVRYRVVLPF